MAAGVRLASDVGAATRPWGTAAGDGWLDHGTVWRDAGMAAGVRLAGDVGAPGAELDGGSAGEVLDRDHAAGDAGGGGRAGVLDEPAGAADDGGGVLSGDAELALAVAPEAPL